MDGRLPAHVEISGLIRRTQAHGGFGVVIRKGERDAGTIIVLLTANGRNHRVFERMPQLDGDRKWALTKSEDVDSKDKIEEYLARRGEQDSDLWVVELDIPDGERLVLNS